ncbi:hypothetical protein [Cytobacillus oceanisediminis]|uniref:hypothetical protein n=1 Tax=Cytobacillus oceanisediminis TaxID=665099 RepID=UPI001642A9E5|nr:hypothetical protein [Cytobacillus oceanisediminis]
MPRGKELEQLPMANSLPGMGEDRSKYNREILTGITENAGTRPAEDSKKKQK